MFDLARSLTLSVCAVSKKRFLSQFHPNVGGVIKA